MFYWIFGNVVIILFGVSGAAMSESRDRGDTVNITVGVLQCYNLGWAIYATAHFAIKYW